MRCKLFFATLLLILLFHFNLWAKVRILTFHYNNPYCILWQKKTFAKFFENEYELIVFNDAKDPRVAEEIRKTCEVCGFQCVRFEQEWHLSSHLNQEYATIAQNQAVKFSWIGSLTPAEYADQPSLRHSHVLQYALEHFGYNHNDIVVIVDGDMFPIRPFNLRSWMRRYDILGLKRIKTSRDQYSDKPISIEYLWPVFVAFNPQNLPNLPDFRFSVDVINGVIEDTGAHSYYYLKKNPQVRVYMCTGYITTAFIKKDPKKVKKYGFNDHEIALINALPDQKHHQIEFHLSQHFLHFSGVSFNYDGSIAKYECVNDFVKKITSF